MGTQYRLRCECEGVTWRLGKTGLEAESLYTPNLPFSYEPVHSNHLAYASFQGETSYYIFYTSRYRIWSIDLENNHLAVSVYHLSEILVFHKIMSFHEAGVWLTRLCKDPVGGINSFTKNSTRK